MVRRLIVSLFLVSLVGCSSISKSLDFPNQISDSTTNGMPSDEYESLLRSQHPEDEDSYNWPVKNAVELLKTHKEGDVVQAMSPDNKPVLFAVLSEYPSAGKKLCKKYFVNLDVHLACYNPHWYPVRSFEE